MKSLLLCLLLWAGPFILHAQCIDPLQSVTFDTTVTGAGNAYHTFTFPKFDASLGTLVEVVIKAEVTLRYRFELENRESVAINNYRVRVVRDDEISGNAIPIPIAHNYQRTYGPYSLAASDGVAGAGSDYLSLGPVYAMNHQVMESTLHNTADYLGAGTVSMDYAASTYSIVFGSVNYNFNGTAEDTVRMTVVYKYCSTWFLGGTRPPVTTQRTQTKFERPILYPNPSNGNFNLVFHNTKRNDYLVEVLNPAGQIVRQMHFSRALTGRVNLQNQLPAGAYFVRIINKKSWEKWTLPVLIR